MKNKNQKSRIDLLSIAISAIVSIIITALFSNNANVFFANLGFLNVQIEIADNARLYNEYGDCAKYYQKIAKGNSKYAPYAHLALAEIYSSEIGNRNYSKALNEYKYAVSGEKNKQILNSAMNFIIQQFTLKNQSERNIYIDFISKENIEFVVEIMNSLNEVAPEVFDDVPYDFPIDENDVKNIFSPSAKFTVKQYKWEYVSATTSDQSNLAHTNNTEKVILVDWREELVDNTSFSTVTVYKYYRYKKVVKNSYAVNSLDALKNAIEPQKPIFLRELDFDS